MTLSLLAFFLAPLYLKITMDPQDSHRLLKELSKNSAMQVAYSMFMLLLALIIFSNTGLHFSWEWESLLAWIGLVVFLKGVFVVLVPSLLQKKVAMLQSKHLPMFGFIGLLFVLALVYVDTQLL